MLLRLCEKVSSIFSSSSVVAVDDGDGDGDGDGDDDNDDDDDDGDGVTVAAAAAAAAIVSMNASSPTFIVSFANLRSSAYFARDDCDLINLIK